MGMVWHDDGCIEIDPLPVPVSDCRQYHSPNFFGQNHLTTTAEGDEVCGLRYLEMWQIALLNTEVR